MLKRVLVLLHLQLPSNRLLCAVNEHKLLGRFCFWILFFGGVGVFLVFRVLRGFLCCFVGVLLRVVVCCFVGFSLN